MEVAGKDMFAWRAAARERVKDCRTRIDEQAAVPLPDSIHNSLDLFRSSSLKAFLDQQQLPRQRREGEYSKGDSPAAWAPGEERGGAAGGRQHDREAIMIEPCAGGIGPAGPLSPRYIP